MWFQDKQNTHGAPSSPVVSGTDSRETGTSLRCLRRLILLAVVLCLATLCLACGPQWARSSDASTVDQVEFLHGDWSVQTDGPARVKEVTVDLTESTYSERRVINPAVASHEEDAPVGEEQGLRQARSATATIASIAKSPKGEGVYLVVLTDGEGDAAWVEESNRVGGVVRELTWDAERGFLWVQGSPLVREGPSATNTPLFRAAAMRAGSAQAE